MSRADREYVIQIPAHVYVHVDLDSRRVLQVVCDDEKAAQTDLRGCAVFRPSESGAFSTDLGSSDVVTDESLVSDVIAVASRENGMWPAWEWGW